MFTYVHIFSVDYSADANPQDCQDAGCELLDVCGCTLCKCCTVCTEQCICSKSSKDPNSIMESILDLGDDTYRFPLFDFFCLDAYLDWNF